MTTCRQFESSCEAAASIFSFPWKHWAKVFNWKPKHIGFHISFSSYFLWEVPGLAARERDQEGTWEADTVGIWPWLNVDYRGYPAAEVSVRNPSGKENSTLYSYRWHKIFTSATYVQLKHGHFTQLLLVPIMPPPPSLPRMVSLYSIGRLELHIFLPLPAILPIGREPGL